MTQRTRFFTLVFRPERLGGILDDIQSVTLCQFPQRFHLRTLAEQMNRDDCPSARGDPFGDIPRIQVSRIRFDIGKDRRCPRSHY
jgi:hypothetical protein